jgi:hypothetical protein
MNRTIVSLVLSISALALACGSAAPAPAAAPTAVSPASLDGKAYGVTLSFDGEAPISDVLSFDKGRFESSACTSLGFPKWTDYQSQCDGSAVSFHVETHNPKGPTIEWDGTVSGSTASGKAKRTIDGKVAMGTFRGDQR